MLHRERHVLAEDAFIEIVVWRVASRRSERP